MKRRFFAIVLFTGLGLVLSSLNVGAASLDSRGSSQVTLDLTKNTFQFGGIPGVRDEEALLEGIYAGENSGVEKDAFFSKETALDDIYRKVSSSINDQITCVDVSEYDMTQEAVVEIVSDVLNNNPGYFYVEGVDAFLNYETGLVESVELTYAANTEEMNREYEAAVAEVLSFIDDDWNDEEKLFFLHDYLVTHCEYDYDTYSEHLKGNYSYKNGVGYTPYGVLVLHTAVCQGYSDTFTDLGRRLDIEVDTVSSRNLNHAWNLATLKGKKYYVDCTWDDPVSGGGNHLFEGCCMHDNFLLSQAGITATGHETNDWVNSSDRECSIYGLYVDTDYDNASWRKSRYSPVVCVDSGVIYYNSDDGFVYKYGCDLTEPSNLMEFGRIWQNASGSEYSYEWYNYCTLLKVGDGLFINNANEVYALDINQGLKTKIHEIKKGNSGEIIYGMIAGDTDIRCDIGTGWSDADKVRSEMVDLSTKITYLSLNKSLVIFNGINGSETLVVTTNAPEVTWSSSNSSVVRVEDGVLTPVGYGYATITATAGTAKTSCRVNVDTTVQDEWEYYINNNKAYINGYKGTSHTVTVPKSFVINGMVTEVAGFKIYNESVIENISFETGFKPFSMRFPTNIKNINFRGVNTSNMTAMTYLFSDCTLIESLDLSGFDTSNVTGMQNMFNNCQSLKILDLSGWDTSKVEDMTQMFFNCQSLTSINLSGWNTSNVTDMSYMFYRCKKLEKLNLSSFDMSKVTKEGSTRNMLYLCNNIKELDTPKGLIFDISLSGDFKDKNGNIYDKLPKNETTSHHLVKFTKLESIMIIDENNEELYDISLMLGTEKKLFLIFEPEGVDDTEVIWESSNPECVSVSSDGTIKAHKGGNDVEISVYSKADRRVCSSVFVNVLTEMEDIYFPEYNYEIIVGQNKKLEYSTVPEGVEAKTVSWRIGNNKIATVDNEGNVTGLKEGSTFVTVTVNGKFTASAEISVVEKKIPIETLEISPDKLEMDPGESVILTITKTPEDATERVTITSSNTAVATVDSVGNIKAVDAGEAEITVSGGKLSKVCHVTVFKRLSAVSLNTNKRTIHLEDTLTLSANVTPDDLAVDLEWKADDGGKFITLTSSSDGKNADISAIGPGKVTVTVIATDRTRSKVITKEASAVITVMKEGTVVLENGLTIVGMKDSYYYAGKPVVPDITVYYDEARLVENKEYTIKCSNNKQPGTAYLTITGKGNYTGKSKSIEYQIEKAAVGSISIKNADVAGIAPSYNFTGDPIYAPEITVTYQGTKLEENRDYIVSYKNHIDAGTATVVIEGIGKYKDSVTKKFKIDSVPITETNIENVRCPYNAGGSKPIPQITYGDYTLKYGVDYKVSWSGNAPGNGNMVVTGQGNFAKKTNKAFVIEQGNLKNAVISVSDVKFKANQKGASYMSKVLIYDTDGKLLKAGKDYILEYTDETQSCKLDKNTGKAVVEIDDVIKVTANPGPSGKYTGSTSTYYSVRGSFTPISKAKTDKIATQEYTGEEIRPKDFLKGLEESEDYEIVAYYNNIMKGNGQILVRGIGDYSGYRVVTFKIGAKKM